MSKHSVYSFFLFCLSFLVVSDLAGQTYITASLRTPGNTGVMAERCGSPYELVLRRGPDNDSMTFVFVSGAGTATIGVDYTFEDGTNPVEMQPGDTVAIMPINVVDDGLNEGTESVHFEIAFLAGTFSDFITLETSIADEYSVEIQGPDTIAWCRDVPYVLLAQSDADEIFWSPSSVFDDSLGTAATVRPVDSGWYYASVGNDTCGAKDSVYFDLAIVGITNPDTVFICADGDGVLLQGHIEGLATDFTWIPTDSLSDPASLTPVANPSVTTTYILQSDIGVCTATDRVVVKVDSLPTDLHIDIAPLKPYYCAGEIVAIFSPSFDTLLYPDIAFHWLTSDNTFLTDDDLLNAALELQDTVLHIRENKNNACVSTDSILINVVPPGIPLSVTDTVLCPGEMFTVTVLSDQVTDPEWTPMEGLSCTQCLSPKVTVIGAPGTSQGYQFSGKVLECPVGASLNIEIPPIKTINIVGDNIVCEGEVIPLTITNPEGLSGYEWDVVFGNASLSCDDCPNPSVTINSGDGPINVIVTSATDDPNFCGAQGFFQFVPGQTNQFTGPTFFACLGETVTVSTGDPTAFDLTWSVFNGDLELSCTECETPTVTVNADLNQLRFIGNTTNPNFCNVSGIVNVNTFSDDPALIAFEPDPAAGPIGQGTNVVATLVVAPPPSSVIWSINGVDITGTGTTIEFNADEELNSVVAKFTNSSGCEQIVIAELPTVPPSYMIPNAFTPNSDELNDRFRIIINGNIVVEEFLIFNRWGQLVYEAQDNNLEGWDGRFKNEPASSDTYVYSAKIRFPDGRTELAKGDVALLR